MTTRKRIFLAVATMLLLSSVAAEARAPDGVPESMDAGMQAETAEPLDRATPVRASEPFDPEAATAAYLARLGPEERARSDAYFEGGNWLQLWGFLYGLGVAWLLLGTGLSARMRDLAERLTRRPALQTATYAVQYTVLTTVLVFPLSLYRGFFREHQYGLSNLGFGGWIVEQTKGLGVGLVLGTLALVLLYAVLRRAPRLWWLWGALVLLAFLGFVLIIAPVFVAPVFNDYTPLEDESIREPILEMARANGVPATDVWVYDASRQTNRITANVSGFLGTERISLADNLLERSTLPEIESVVGHELGHYVLNHVYEMFVELGLVIVLGFAFLRWTFERVRQRWGGGWDVRGIGDVAGLPLLGALLSVYFFAMTPVVNTIVRTNEAEADLFGINASRQPDGFAEAALKLAEYRKLDPGPVEEFVFYDHPSGRARIFMAMQWKAARLGGGTAATETEP